MRTPILFVAAASLAASSLLRSQSWQPLLPRAVLGHGMAYDSARDRVVVFGGLYAAAFGAIVRPTDTFELDAGGSMRAVTTAHAPPPRYYALLAYDAARGRVVLFGGDDAASARLADTWEYDGTDWQAIATATSPPARSLHHLVYDGVAGRTVLFGGSDANQDLLADTWDYDGVDWRPVATPTSPPARMLGAMAAGNGTVVLFGGRSASGYLIDTWHYDGVTWSNHSAFGAPGPRSESELAYDAGRGRFVLYGGVRTIGFALQTLGDTWEYDGTTWMPQTPATSPPQLRSHRMVARGNSGDVYLFGGATGFTDHRGGHTWDGTTWQPVASSRAAPRVRDFGLAYDRGRDRTVLFGGYDAAGGGPRATTFELTGDVWSPVATPTSPSPRDQVAMTYDVRRGRVVLFGGYGVAATVHGDTWEYDGSTWTQVAAGFGPSARYATAMTYDLGREVAVLSGGFTGANILADTWEYANGSWQQIATANSPGPHYRHALAYDRQRERVVFVPGAASGQGVYLYDGSDWTFVGNQPASYPFGSAAYDTGRGRVATFPEINTYEYGPGGWSFFTYPDPPVLASGGRVIYDDARGALVRVGVTGDTEIFTADPEAHWAGIGAGCPGSAGVPALAGTPPALGGTMALTLSDLPASPGVWFLAFAFYSPTRAGQPLPRHLDGFGLPGCRLWIDSLAGAGALVGHGGGQGTFGLAIPNDPALAGLRLFHQAFVFDPLAVNGLGAFSNAAVGTVR
ncbi:MAG: hypothetical protein KDE27_04010 [Planctomycetes bacterium]|nr:hypothetical protein [Planctomycetota bacterium]